MRCEIIPWVKLSPWGILKKSQTVCSSIYFPNNLQLLNWIFDLISTFRKQHNFIFQKQKKCLGCRNYPDDIFPITVRVSRRYTELEPRPPRLSPMPRPSGHLINMHMKTFFGPAVLFTEGSTSVLLK